MRKLQKRNNTRQEILGIFFKNILGGAGRAVRAEDLGFCGGVKPTKYI